MRRPLRLFLAAVLACASCSVFPDVAPRREQHDSSAAGATADAGEAEADASNDVDAADASDQVAEPIPPDSADADAPSPEPSEADAPGPDADADAGLDAAEADVVTGEADASPAVDLDLPIASGSDDVNEDGSTYEGSAAEVWLGNGQSQSKSRLGLRFASVPIPPGATILSARVWVRSSTTAWISVDMNIAAEDADSCATFSQPSPPSKRALGSASVKHSSNDKWDAGSWYALDESSALVQPIVQRSGWKSGNALCIVATGTGAAYGRKHVASFEGAPAGAARLKVRYEP